MGAIDRLVFLGLISMADDYGRLHDNVKIIDAFIFPNTDDSVRESLANLSRINRIVRGKSSSGMPIIEIVNWTRHQKVDKPQPKLALPAIAKTELENTDSNNKNTSQNTVLELVANDSRTDLELVAPLTPTNDPDQRPTTPSTIGRPVRECPPTVEDIGFYLASIGKDTSEAQKIFDFYCANGWVQGNEAKPIVDWHATTRAWFNSNVAKRSRNGPTTFAEQRVKNTQTAIEEFANGQ